MTGLEMERGGASRSMPTYDDGTTPTLVTEKPPAIAVRTANTGANGSGVCEELAHTVDTTGPESVAYVLKVRGGSETYTKRDGRTGTAGKGALMGEDVSFTVAATQDQTLFDPTPQTDGGGDGRQDGVGYVVRRLTPTECERLQGMPDGHTKIPWRGRPAEECPDGPRYKAIGNSMAVPVMRWIGERIGMVDEALGDGGGHGTQT